jgi:hypothetical protein
MKTIHYFNHSIVDGERGMLAANGTRLASFLGKRYAEDDRTKFCEKTFVAPQHLAAQTALSFLLTYVEVQMSAPQIMPTIFELGTEALMKKITSHSQFEVLASAGGKYQAVLDCYGSTSNVTLSLRARAVAAVNFMFNAMEDGELALAFGADPMISLAVSGVQQGHILPEKYEQLLEMEGVILEGADVGFVFKAIDRIAIPASP